MLGDLPEKDRSEVEKNLLQYPELKAEFLRLEEVQEKFIMQAAINPRASVKTDLLAKIKSQNQERVFPIAGEKSPVNYWRYAAAASILLALFSSYMAYNYWSKLRVAETSLNEYIAQNQRMAQDYNNVNKRLDKFEDDLSVMEDPSFKRITMNGTDNAPGALAYVYWNAETKALFLRVHNLKQLAQDSQYQLWAIVDGKPVDAGVFDAQLTGLIKMKEIIGAAAFAVTIEPHGGKESPTLETMQVIGNVEKS